MSSTDKETAQAAQTESPAPQPETAAPAAVSSSSAAAPAKVAPKRATLAMPEQEDEDLRALLYDLSFFDSGGEKTGFKPTQSRLGQGVTASSIFTV